MTPTIVPSPRYIFVDRLRGWAVIIMIETHVVNALLNSTLRRTFPQEVLDFFNGLVAPSFLFCAGFAFAIASIRKWHEYTRFELPARRYARRLLFVLAIGYSLHLPFFALHRLLTLQDRESWISFFQVDILQTISVSLLSLLALAILIRRQRTHVGVTLAAAIIIICASPLMNHGRPEWMPITIGGFFSHDYASRFPLFPWAVFLFTGYLIGWWFMKTPSGGISRTIHRLFFLAVTMIAGSLLAQELPLNVYRNLSFWADSPQFVLLRIGCVLLLMLFLYRFEPAGREITLIRKDRPPGVPLLFGRESLLVYVVHLLIVYGQDYPWSLYREFGPTLSYFQCAKIFLIVALAMYLLAWFWHWLKSYNLKWAKTVQYAVIGIGILRFILA